MEILGQPSHLPEHVSGHKAKTFGGKPAHLGVVTRMDGSVFGDQNRSQITILAELLELWLPSVSALSHAEPSQHPLQEFRALPLVDV
jgi:hypothetical protein